jgi:prepilin-type N-terminal cleavage/methylation domain-containing protein
MRFPASLERRGFTLIEAIIAMTILAIALLGTFMGLVEAARVSREGQLRQYKTELIDAKLQRLLLADKTVLPNMVGGLQTVPASLLAPSLSIGAAPWVIDPSAPDPSSLAPGSPMPGDLGIGSVFQVWPDGEIRPLAGPFASCVDPAIPVGAYCREVLLHNRLLLPGSAPNTQIQNNLDAVNARSSTLWIRVFRKGESANFAVVERKVLVL